MAAEDTNTENNYTAELVKKTVDVLNSKENIDLFTQFAWEICGAESDFSTPVKLEENEANLIQPGLKDIIFTKIATLGHRDKFPRQYDWENLIPTLAADEELFWIAHKKTDKTFDLFLGLKNNNQRIIHSSSFKSRSDRFQVLCDLFSKRSFPESSLVYQTPDETARELNSITEMPHAFCLTGMPSYKDSEYVFALSPPFMERQAAFMQLCFFVTLSEVDVVSWAGVILNPLLVPHVCPWVIFIVCSISGLSKFFNENLSL